jgi:hypothetical protein
VTATAVTASQIDRYGEARNAVAAARWRAVWLVSGLVGWLVELP